MPQLINIVVQDDVWRFLKQVTPDERNRVINQALRDWARRRRRLDAVTEMDHLRSGPATKPTNSDEIVRWIREDRETGH